MSSIYHRFRTGILSIGAFALGIAFEKNFQLSSHIADSNVDDSTIVASSGDSFDLTLAKLSSAEHHSSPSASSPSSPSEISLIVKHGFPSLDSLRSYPNFLVSYDRRNRIPHWVLERLTTEKLSAEQYNRKGLDFCEDGSVHRFFRATNKDYKGSGYDRGHLAAAGNYRADPDHIKATYVLSNIAPQVGRGFNRDKWNELEKYCRGRVRQHGEVWVCTGPLFLPARDSASGKLFIKHEVIGKSHVSVPTHFFKAILYRPQGELQQQAQSGQSQIRD